MKEDKIYQEAPDGYHYVFPRYKRLPNGKCIYPKKGRCFRFLVKDI